MEKSVEEKSTFTRRGHFGETPLHRGKHYSDSLAPSVGQGPHADKSAIKLIKNVGLGRGGEHIYIYI